MVKRTRKEFQDYNDYHDRPFGLKWGTAFAMDELVVAIEKNEFEDTKKMPQLEAMTREEIDTILVMAFKKHLPVEIQLNERDEFGRLKEKVQGYFEGEASKDYFMLDNVPYEWENVRHASLSTLKKWSETKEF